MCVQTARIREQPDARAGDFFGLQAQLRFRLIECRAIRADS